ncbi:MAG: hypothetical protein AAGK47_07845 [Bacteroidota bacterium]
MNRILFFIFIGLFLASCGNDPLDVEFNIEEQYVYEQITGTFYQIEAHLEAEDPNFDYVGTELTTERVEIGHCKLFRGIQGDTVELWDRSIYKEVVDNIREGRIYNVEYDKMIDPNGFDKTLGVIGDELRQTRLSVPRAFNEAGEAYKLKRTATGQVVLTTGAVSKTVDLSQPIETNYMVVNAATNEEIKIEETHRIIRVIENPIIKYPTTQFYCH